MHGVLAHRGSTEPNWPTPPAERQRWHRRQRSHWAAVLDPLAIDSDDPERPGVVDFRSMNRARSTYHTWATYHVPLIVSCGTGWVARTVRAVRRDNFGTLAQPQFDTDGYQPALSSWTALYDNITNHQK